MDMNEFKAVKDYTRKPKACGPLVFKRNKEKIKER